MTKKIAKTASAKPAAKKTAPKAAKKVADGYKGHRAGSLKEKIHMLFDKHGAEKARPMCVKLVAESTVNTSFSQFRALAKKK